MPSSQTQTLVKINKRDCSKIVVGYPLFREVKHKQNRQLLDVLRLKYSIDFSIIIVYNYIVKRKEKINGRTRLKR